MGQWIKNVYKIGIKELDDDRALDFAKCEIRAGKDNNLYNRYNLEFTSRIEKTRCGKLAEQAFAIFLNETMDADFPVNYEIYQGERNVDDDDFEINGFKIDVKASKDTQQRGIEACINYFNFPVPKDQTIKDITVSVIYDYYVENFYIVKWVDHDTYLKNYIDGTFPGGNGARISFYKLPLRRGYSIDTLRDYLDI